MSTEEVAHHIVALEAIHCPIPDFDLPGPHTRSIHKWTTPAELSERVKDATIVITTTIRLSAEILKVDKTPHLRLIVVLASGTDCVDKEAATARGIPVCNCPGTNIESVSEHAIGLYFATRRNLVHLTNVVTTVPAEGETEWKKKGSLHPKLRTADGKAPLLCSEETVGIIGYGALGRRIQKLATALGMKVIIAERRGEKPRADRVSFEDALRQSTVLVLCLPRTPETVNMISTEEFRMMPCQAVLVNVARGGIVDEAALVAALKQGEIFGAGMDVFANEPLGRGGSPLLETEGLNLVLSPHLAWLAEKSMGNLQAGVKATVERWCVGDTINRVA
ncbi:Glycerate dehydrogenase [Penicillium rolfsii]|nr:Glycerate dehydrogenase [Penicillium rolfsii]